MTGRSASSRLVHHHKLAKGGYTVVRELLAYPGIHVHDLLIDSKAELVRGFTFDGAEYSNIEKAIEAWKGKYDGAPTGDRLKQSDRDDGGKTS